MKKIVTLFTCYNRKEKTEICIRRLVEANKNCEFIFVILDDNSNDGTKELLELMKNDYTIHVLNGNGKSYYSRGMRKVMLYALNNVRCDYALLVNDDVEFLDSSIEQLIEQSESQDNSVVVGAMNNDKEQVSYSAIKYRKKIKYDKLQPSEWNVKADTFNANCVLIPYFIFQEVQVIDNKYVHSLGDFDYGLAIKNQGYNIYCSKIIAGICNNNSNVNTWRDNSLSVIKRLKMKENVKGDPFKQWWYFLKKNFGFKYAIIYSVSPYVKIFLRK